MKPLLLAFYFVSVCIVCTFAQEPRQNIVTEKKTDPNASGIANTLFPFHSIESWTGKRFTFLPKPKFSQSDAYDDFFDKLNYEKHVGRIAKVVSVSDFSGRAHLVFEMEDNGERLRARTIAYKESVKGMALVDDFENARKQWLGKTFWCRAVMISTYDEKSDTLSPLRVKKYSPVKVIDIVYGWDEEKPVRFLLETADGKRGFIDMNLSGTNVQKEMRYLSRFDDHLMTEDPRLKYKWSAQIWKTIENAQVITGMTAEQVKMSWGEPEKITRATAGEQWTYPGGTLLMKNGVLTRMQ